MHAETHRNFKIRDSLCDRWCFAHETDASEDSSLLRQTITFSERAEIPSAFHPHFFCF